MASDFYPCVFAKEPDSKNRGSAKRQAALLRRNVLLGACFALLASCGGGDGGRGPGSAPVVAEAAVAQAAGASNATPLPDPLAHARCAMDAGVEASYEEQRLLNKLDPSDATSFSQQLLQSSGFDKFGPAFALKLCADGIAGVPSYDQAVMLVKAEGLQLWQAALDRVQGRKVEGTLHKSDDRMLYWARLTMTLALRQWRPDFALDDEQRAALQNEFERASRGQYAIDFPEGTQYKRILVSGFDPFTLGEPGIDGDPSIRIGNPSGATILSLDGNTMALADGTTAVVRTFILPVNYRPFQDGMQEDTLGPWFKSGSKRVDASITVSQGSDDFALEHFNGRYHFLAFPGNDGVEPACASGYPASDECDIHPPQRWLGYSSKPWKKEMPPQFTPASLPFQLMIDAKTGSDIVHPATGRLGGWDVVRNDTYSMRPCTKAAGEAQEAYDLLVRARDEAQRALSAAGQHDFSMYMLYVDAQEAANAGLPPATEVNCAYEGGGGAYLSNASAYRNTLMRDLFGLDVPAGHIHTPRMTVFGPDSNQLTTDVTFEAHREAIMAQTRNLVWAVARSLVPRSIGL